MGERRMNLQTYLEHNNPEDELFEEEKEHLRNPNKSRAEVQDLKDRLRGE